MQPRHQSLDEAKRYAAISLQVFKYEVAEIVYGVLTNKQSLEPHSVGAAVNQSKLSRLVRPARIIGEARARTGPSLIWQDREEMVNVSSCSACTTERSQSSTVRLTRTRGMLSRGTGAVCHMSEPDSSKIFSSLVSCLSTTSGSILPRTVTIESCGRRCRCCV